MTSTVDSSAAHAPLTPAQHAERVRRATAALDRALRDLIATHQLPTPSTTSHRVEPDGTRSLVLVAGDADTFDAWCPHIDSTGVVSPGPYPCGSEKLRVRVGKVAGVDTVLIVDDALQVLTARPGDVTVDADRDPVTGTAVQ